MNMLQTLRWECPLLLHGSQPVFRIGVALDVSLGGSLLQHRGTNMSSNWAADAAERLRKSQATKREQDAVMLEKSQLSRICLKQVLRENVEQERASNAEHGLVAVQSLPRNRSLRLASDGSVAPAYHSIPARTLKAQNAGRVTARYRRYIGSATSLPFHPQSDPNSPLALSLGRHSLASATSLKLCARRTLPCTHGNQPWPTSPRHRSEWFSARWIMTH